MSVYFRFCWSRFVCFLVSSSCVVMVPRGPKCDQRGLRLQSAHTTGHQHQHARYTRYTSTTVQADLSTLSAVYGGWCIVVFFMCVFSPSANHGRLSFVWMTFLPFGPFGALAASNTNRPTKQNKAKKRKINEGSECMRAMQKKQQTDGGAI